jgi:PPOX class probable F420-dependent enzyme
MDQRVTFSPDALEVLNKRALAIFGTLLKDGSPHSAIAGVIVDGDQLVTHTAPAAQRVKNLKRDPRINVMVIDPDTPLKYVEVRGTAELREMDGGVVDPLFKQQNEKYGLPPQASEPRPGMTIIQVRITPHKAKFFFFNPREMGPKRGQLDGQGATR